MALRISTQGSSNSYLSNFIGSIEEHWASTSLGLALSSYGVYTMMKGLRRNKPLKSGIVGGLSLAGGALLYRGVSGLVARLTSETDEFEDELTSPAARVAHGEGVKVEESVVVSRTPQELYDFWRDLENLPSIMRHLKSVVSTDDTHSHWIVRGPIGSSVEWDAEIFTDEPGSLISWRSMPGAEVDHAGSVQFEELGDGHGTTITVMLKYDPPAGKLGALVAEVLGEDPAKQIRHDLRQFKKSVERQGALSNDDGDMEDRSGSSSRRR